VTVPLATYTGWALRSGAQANDGCEGSGQMIPFAKTAAERAASRDPRPSVEERYGSFKDYHRKVKHALEDMVKDRLMLCEDTVAEEQRLVQNGLDRGVPPPEDGLVPLAEMPNQCRDHRSRGNDDDRRGRD
jgi:hypothetical protein